MRAGSSDFTAGIGLLACLLAATLAAASSSDPRPSYLKELVERARAEELASDTQWRTLLHSRVHPVLRRRSSHADDPDFFLASDGATNHQAELEATLAAFFEEDLRALGEDQQQHAQCAFIARYHWLKERLEFDSARLRERECPAYAEWHAALDATGLTLIFAEAFMNNPASMFGHTLLRVDTHDSVASRDLLGWAINYSGATGNESGPLYAMKGVFGFYSGYYDVRPYYEKVKEYGDWENRDIWEYPIDLDDTQRERLLQHLWELQGIAFDYYYFDENCSYQLLALLEVARPDLELTEAFPAWVIPADTVRVTLDQVGMLGPPHFRPSAATELQSNLAQLDDREMESVRALVEGRAEPDAPEISALPEQRRAAVLGVAYDQLRYAYLSREVERSESKRRARKLLVARSRVAHQGAALESVPMPDVRPDEGHGSARFTLASGYRDNEPYFEMRLRPALHEWTDAIGGYTPGAQIQILDVSLRYLPHDRKLRLQELVLLDLGSLVPWDPVFRKVSYGFDMGLRTRWRPDDDGIDPELVWRTRGSYGFTAALGPRFWLYGLAEVTTEAGGNLSPEYAVGVGPRLGVQWRDAEDRFAGQGFARMTSYLLGDTTTAAQVGVEQRWKTTRNTAWVLSGSWNRDFHNSWYDAGLRWHVYF